MAPENSRPLPDSRVDRISDLPDSILGHILSFLPTRSAVATGFLSQRWKFLWTTAINLVFRYPDAYTYDYSDDEYSDDDDSQKRKAEFKEKITRFVEYVNYVLLLHKPGCLNKFSLEWKDDYDSFYVNAWITTALARNVHELFVSTRDLPIQVQRSMFSCESLLSLELELKRNKRWPMVCLPKLKSLKLISVCFQCEEAFSKLLAGCPRLKYLNMHMDVRILNDRLSLDIDTVRNRVPKSMFNCEGLQSLELKCNICISPEIVISLPKLESLKLLSVYFQCEESFCKLLAGCPLLKYLYIDTNLWNHLDRDNENVFRYIVSSASLRHLELCVHDEYDAYDNYSDDDGTAVCSVVLSAPSLVYIKLKKQISSIFILENLSSLVEANLELVVLESEPEHDHCNQLVEAFNAFDCAETLTLSSDVIWALSCATVKLKTRFKRLSKLKVNIGTSSWSSLQDFIELSDNLEVLTVNKQSYCVNKDGENNSNWKNPNQVPSCLSNSLKTVSFGAYDGGADLLAMVCYLLKHGNVLKVVHIDFSRSSISLKNQFMLVQKISILPMKSTDCKVQFR